MQTTRWAMSWTIHLSRFAAATALLLWWGPSFADPAGRVLFATGEAIATDAAGHTRPLERSSTVEEGDTISTGQGRLQIKFKDGGYLALPPGSRLRIDRYQYTAAGDREDGVVMSLLKGGLRTISGLVGKRNRSDYRMETSVATIGIRGTDYALDLDSVLVGNVADGAIEVCNGAGCLLVHAGQAFYVPSLNQIPVLGERRAFLPPTPREDSGRGAGADKGLAGQTEGNFGRASGPSGAPGQSLGPSGPGAPGNSSPSPQAGPGGGPSPLNSLPGPAASPGGNSGQGRLTAPGLTGDGIGAPAGPPGLKKTR